MTVRLGLVGSEHPVSLAPVLAYRGRVWSTSRLSASSSATMARTLDSSVRIDVRAVDIPKQAGDVQQRVLRRGRPSSSGDD